MASPDIRSPAATTERALPAVGPRPQRPPEPRGQSLPTLRRVRAMHPPERARLQLRPQQHQTTRVCKIHRVVEGLRQNRRGLCKCESYREPCCECSRSTTGPGPRANRRIQAECRPRRPPTGETLRCPATRPPEGRQTDGRWPAAPPTPPQADQWPAQAPHRRAPVVPFGM